MNKTSEEWLKIATRFDLGNNSIQHNRRVIIETRPQIDDSVLWVVKMDNWVLGKDNRWYYEPLPSSRSKKFVDKTRFQTPNEALKQYMECKELGFQPLFI